MRSLLGLGAIWKFTKIRGTFLGVPIVRTIVYWGLYWGPLILGNYHIGSTTLAPKPYAAQPCHRGEE